MEAKWYTVRVYSGQEEKVRQQIESELEIAGIADRVHRIIVPSENVIEMKDGKKREKKRIFFPGYIMIEMELDKETQFVVTNTAGVVSFVGSQNVPQALRPDEVDRILMRVDQKRDEGIVDVPFKVGDAIKIIDGPFNDFSGFIDEINYEKSKVKVMVSIFGRSTPVELDFLQIELEK